MAGPFGRTGESRFAIRRGDVMVPLLLADWTEFEDEEFQPMPDSRKMDDLIGSGEFESSRSRRGDFRDAMEKSKEASQSKLNKQQLVVGTILRRASHVMVSTQSPLPSPFLPQAKIPVIPTTGLVIAVFICTIPHMHFQHRVTYRGPRIES